MLQTSKGLGSLIAMGYAPSQALDALEETDGDVPKAKNLLHQGLVFPPETYIGPGYSPLDIENENQPRPLSPLVVNKFDHPPWDQSFNSNSKTIDLVQTNETGKGDEGNEDEVREWFCNNCRTTNISLSSLPALCVNCRSSISSLSFSPSSFSSVSALTSSSFSSPHSRSSSASTTVQAPTSSLISAKPSINSTSTATTMTPNYIAPLSSSVFAADQWICGDCGVLNSATYSKCQICETPRDETPITPSHSAQTRICPACTHSNVFSMDVASGDLICSVCQCPLE